MADSSNSTGRQMGYYCHACKCRTPSTTERFTCSSCDSGFIEEVQTIQPDNAETMLNGFFSSNSSDLQNENILNFFASMDGSNVNAINLGRILTSMLVGGNQGNGQFIRFLHGNPDDYVWSTDGLDSVITQLLNQIDNAGPPPMNQEDIDKLKEISITNEHVNNKLQCPICMEDFVLDEKVKELNCHHFFHNDCINEWLKLHSICPMCRLEFNKKDDTSKTATDQNVNFASTSSTSNTSTTNRQNNRPNNASSSSTANQSSSSNYNYDDDDLD